MDYSTASWAKCETVLAKFILKYLQDCGGQAERSVIREALLDEDEDIAKFAEFVKIAKKTGAEYRPFAYKFNFTIKDLLIAGYISYTRAKPLITLTQKGANFNVDKFDYERDMNSITKKYWNEQHKAAAARKNKTTNATSAEDEEVAGVDKADEYEEEFKNKLLAAIGNMSPKKFELFSRALLSKMGVEFTSVGTQISNDGGIDGYGYCRTDDYRTSRVVIQCKRWQGSVGSVEIDQFLGAMNKFQADYGIFVTNSRYTSSAREAARAGTPITLIDGDELVRLVKKYQLYIIPVTTYILDDFYESE